MQIVCERINMDRKTESSGTPIYGADTEEDAAKEANRAMSYVGRTSRVVVSQKSREDSVSCRME